MNVLLLSRYSRLGASSRVRSLQYLPFLRSKGWHVDVYPLFSDGYLRALYDGQSHWSQVLAGYWHRFLALVRAKKYDLIWLEKEVYPFMPALAERLLVKSGLPYVVDYDDALFHRYDQHPSRLVRVVLGHKIDTVMRHAALVIAGNEYLAEHARRAGTQSVAIVPTVVDLDRYSVVQQEDADHAPVIGWIGSPSTSRYLTYIAPTIESLTKSHNIRFVAVGASEDALKGMPVEIWPWSETTEVKSIQAFDIGIMPLPDSYWEQGKCGYKLIQYMACGRPVVASPVGANKKIVKHAVNGFLARTSHEWNQYLEHLLSDTKLRWCMGVNGRNTVEEWYSIQVQAPRFERLIREIFK